MSCVLIGSSWVVFVAGVQKVYGIRNQGFFLSWFLDVFLVEPIEFCATNVELSSQLGLFHFRGPDLLLWLVLNGTRIPFSFVLMLNLLRSFLIAPAMLQNVISGLELDVAGGLLNGAEYAVRVSISPAAPRAHLSCLH